jgi:response regulator RpfG family c-di-GMP phosphodiesterase
MNAHILVVDDEPEVRELLATWLEGAGYRATCAADAADAMTVLAAGPVDIVLLDLAMPERDGLWLARQCREQFSDLALILVTGLQCFDAAVEGMRLGIRDYLVKPFTRHELVDSVRRAADWRSSQRRERDADVSMRRGIRDYLVKPFTRHELVDSVRRAVEWRSSQRRERDADVSMRRDLDRRTLELSDNFAGLDPASAAGIEDLLVTLHRRSPDAGAHARRIARMAVDLGASLELEPRALADIERAALLHDIGKVAMPDALMYKPGPLTDDDIALLRTHVEVGHTVVSTIPALREAAGIIVASHEAWDGSGYPRGLAGEAIHIGARIISVVDTFDALTWGLSHRDPVSCARAAAELVRSAGTQFDPAVVHAWLRVCDGLQDRDEPVDASPLMDSVS